MKLTLKVLRAIAEAVERSLADSTICRGDRGKSLRKARCWAQEQVRRREFKSRSKLARKQQSGRAVANDARQRGGQHGTVNIPDADPALVSKAVSEAIDRFTAGTGPSNFGPIIYDRYKHDAAGDFAEHCEQPLARDAERDVFELLFPDEPLEFKPDPERPHKNQLVPAKRTKQRQRRKVRPVRKRR